MSKSFFIEEMLKNSKVFDRSVTIFDRDSAIDGKSIIYHGRFIPCRFSCQSREMYNKKTFYPSRERIEKEKRKYSNLIYDQHIHVSLIFELWKVMEKIQSFDLSIFFVLYIRKDMTIVFARG